MEFNYDLVSAHHLRVIQHSTVEFWVVGVGGTGSWLCASVVRLARTLTNNGKTVRVYFVDPDVVEAANVWRQCFCDKEIGLSKAKTLALRYSLAWGIEITAIAERFQPNWVTPTYHTLSIIIGCVDNAAARQSLASVLKFNDRLNRAPSIWYLDCGNSKTSGQVLLGSNLDLDIKKYAFSELGPLRLPSPTIQHPELLVPLPEELENNNLSCEQLAALNAQSLDINQRVAAEATNYLIGLTTGTLKRFATYFDTSAGSARSLYITEANVSNIVLSAQQLSKNSPQSPITTATVKST